MHEVDVAPMSPERLVPLLRPDRGERLRALAEAARRALQGRTVWNVSSTAAGGGVAEMLHRQVRYAKGAGVSCRWVVVDAPPAFFAVTKRVHNRLHGERGDDGMLGDAERDQFAAVAASNAAALDDLVRPADVVIVHDPQPVGLVPVLRKRGASVVWRSHVGTETTDQWTEEAWGFLRPWVDAADAAVFSRRAYVPDWLAPDRVRVIPPAIDPLAAKNQALDDDVVLAILGRSGVIAHPDGPAAFVDADGLHHEVSLAATVVREGGPLAPDVPLVVQVSRWDRLKDMAGVLRAFVEADVGPATGGHLLLVGPDVAGVTDDPEGRAVLDECRTTWQELPVAARATASLVSLPMADLEQNAAIVNALQRHAAVVSQKSIREGFGLTVSEAMWKGTPVVGSRVGGIQDQVRDGVDGFLVADPFDLDTFATALRTLLVDAARARAMGRAGHERVRDDFLADRDLGQWMELLGSLGPGA
ncbi:MAG: glycosyltransferase [Acidimicrobiia bacterium]|nr:glycosyltransferase [Acidimicrobiia bacterium]